MATAIVAAIGNGAVFRKERDSAAWLGVVPRQYSTGGKTRLPGISKRGNVYLRNTRAFVVPDRSQSPRRQRLARVLSQRVNFQVARCSSVNRVREFARRICQGESR
jgi:transposase